MAAAASSSSSAYPPLPPPAPWAGATPPPAAAAAGAPPAAPGSSSNGVGQPHSAEHYFKPLEVHGPAYSTPALLVRMVEDNTVVEHQGVVVVLGDVQRGSEVHATGDVIVWGRLSGSASAGTGGNRGSIVLAQQMTPQRVSIAGVVAVAPEGDDSLPVTYAEMAVLDEASGQIQLVPATKLSSSAAAATASFPASAAAAAVGGGASAAARASFFTGLYILALGLALVVAPRGLFGLLFGASGEAVATGWVRVGGMLASLFGFYYLGAAYGERARIGLGGFYLSTVAGRVLLAAGFAILVITGEVGPGLLVLAAANLISAASMARAVFSQ